MTLRLSRGEDVSGRVAQLDGDCVKIKADGKSVTIYPDILAGWEVHHGEDSQPAPHDRTDPAHEPQPTDSGRPTSTHDIRAADVEAALARIEAKFSEAVKRARLALPEPDFRFPDDEFSEHDIDAIRRDWDRAQNRYQYALKVNEPARLNDVVVQLLAPLAQTHPESAATRSLLGRVLLKLSRRSEAVEHLAAAAALSEAPDHWLALAAATADDTATECYALRRYFGLTAPTDAKEAWFRYLAVANPIDLTGAGRVINRWSSAGSGENAYPDHLLSESLVHLLLSSGSRELAQQAAANLVHDSGRLPTGWQEGLDRATAPSEELRAAERRLARSPTPVDSPSRPNRPHGTSPAIAVAPPTTDQLQALQRRFCYGRSDFRHGRIKSFGNQRFGFIQEDAGDAVFFRINDVTDQGLQEALLNESWRTSGEVEFKVHPSPGHKYHHATEIVRTSTESLLQRARSHLDTGQLAQAMGCVRRALQVDPADNTARVLEVEIGKGLQKQLRRGTGLPRGNGPYARAKRAQLVNQDPDKAEQLFRQAIRTHDKKESAIKDLASLLHQHGRTNEAIALLTEHAEQFKHDTSFDNMLATLYQHADRHDEALDVLTKLLDSTAGAKQVPLLRRAAYCYIRCQRYLDAERALQDMLSIDPQNRTAPRWLAELQDARKSGTEPDIVGSGGPLGDEGVELSLLAYAAIDQCTYEGVDRTKLQSGTAGHKEASHVLELARNVGIKRPRDQAAYYLSAAALLKHHTDGDQSTQIYECLRKYFASMADLYWGERKPADVVRTYYIESLALVSENDDSYDAWRILFRYFETFSRGLPDKGNVRFPRASHNEDSVHQKRKDAIRKILELMASDSPTTWMDGLLAVGSQSGFAEATIGPAIQASRSLQAAFGMPSAMSPTLKRDGRRNARSIGEIGESA